MKHLIQITCVFLLTIVAPASAHAAAMPPSSFADLSEELLPTVVNISTRQEVEVPQMGFNFPDFPENSPFNEFFKRFFDERMMPFPPGGDRESGPNGPPTPRREISSLGSGFIISADGHVVTNNHVISQADEITVILSDETELAAEVIGRDPKTDIAVLKVEYDKPLPHISWGDSDGARVGDWILAIGNPFGLGGTVTAGIISARARDINAGPYDDFFQTDASINRGNSGGPMFTLDGRVIGINTAIFSPTGGSVGIGFAVPSNLAKPVVDQLLEFGRTRRGWLGVRIQTVTPELAESLGMSGSRGALVASVTPGGPADDAGVEPGDVIVEFNGRPIEEMRELPRVVAETGVGESAKVKLLRGGRMLTEEVTLGELEKAEEELAGGEAPEPEETENEDNSNTTLGMSLAPLTDELRDRFGLSDETQGVVVISVDRTSVAAQQAIRAGDVIAEVNRQRVRRPADVEDLIRRAHRDDQNNVLMRILGSSGSARFVALPLKEDE